MPISMVGTILAEVTTFGIHGTSGIQSKRRAAGTPSMRDRVLDIRLQSVVTWLESLQIERA